MWAVLCVMLNGISRHNVSACSAGRNSNNTKITLCTAQHSNHFLMIGVRCPRCKQARKARRGTDRQQTPASSSSSTLCTHMGWTAGFFEDELLRAGEARYLAFWPGHCIYIDHDKFQASMNCHVKGVNVRAGSTVVDAGPCKNCSCKKQVLR